MMGLGPRDENGKTSLWMWLRWVWDYATTSTEPEGK
jgi:hypothetical protein